MKPSQKIITTLLMLTLFLSACAPRAESIPPTATPSPVPTATVTPAPTPTPIPPMLVVGGDIPCYAGPGSDYETLTAISIVMTVKVLSKDSNGDYWIVKTPDGSSQCWIESKYSTIIGQAEAIPTLSAEAVPTKIVVLPESPGNLTVSATCVAILDARSPWNSPKAGDKKTFYVKLMWADSKNETGYRIYKDGVLLAELEKNTIEYTDSFVADKSINGKFVYTLEAINDAGVSPTIEVVFYPKAFCK